MTFFRLIHMCYMEMALVYLKQWQNTTTDPAEPPPEPAESDEVMMMMMMQELIMTRLCFWSINLKVMLI